MIGGDNKEETGSYGRTGGKFVSINEDPYPSLRGETVEVGFSGGQTAYGIYKGLDTGGNVVLIPFIDREALPANPNIPAERRRQVYFWNNLGPCFITRESIIKINPVNRTYLDDLVKQTNLGGDEIQGELFDSEVR